MRDYYCCHEVSHFVVFRLFQRIVTNQSSHYVFLMHVNWLRSRLKEKTQSNNKPVFDSILAGNENEVEFKYNWPEGLFNKAE